MRNIPLRQIRAVIAVCEEGSFTRAAERENATQSGISQHVAAVERSNNCTPSVRSTAATCCEMPDWVVFSRSAARVNEPSSQTAMTARICRNGILAIKCPQKLTIRKYNG